MPSARSDRSYDEHEVKVKGIPYKNANYEMGTVTTYNVKEDSLLLRYNAYRDQFEILDKTRKTTYLAKDEKSVVELDDLIYRYEVFFAAGKQWSGYINPLNKGKTLLLRRRIKTAQVRFPDNGYDEMEKPEFEDITEYFIKKDGKIAERLRHLSRKEVFAILWDKYSELRRYSKKEKLQMRNEEEVIQVLAHYDFLKTKEKDTENSEE